MKSGWRISLWILALKGLWLSKYHVISTLPVDLCHHTLHHSLLATENQLDKNLVLSTELLKSIYHCKSSRSGQCEKKRFLAVVLM